MPPLYPLPIIIALSFQLDSVETHLFRRYVCSELIRTRNALSSIIIYGKGANNWIMYQSFFFHCYLTILLQYKIYRWKRKNYIVSNRCLWVLLQYDYILLTWEYKKEIFSIALFLDITAYTNVFTCFIFCKKSSKCFKQHYCILFKSRICGVEINYVFLQSYSTQLRHTIKHLWNIDTK